MEELYNLATQYAVFPIAAICFGVGYIIKHYIKKLPNKFIPVILACLGLILNLVFNNFTFTFDVIITGIGSGLISTGSFEAVRNLINKKSKNENETEPVDKNE